MGPPNCTISEKHADRVQKRIVSSPALNIASKEVRLLAYLVRGERHLIERHNVVR